MSILSEPKGAVGAGGTYGGVEDGRRKKVWQRNRLWSAFGVSNLSDSWEAIGAGEVERVGGLGLAAVRLDEESAGRGRADRLSGWMRNRDGAGLERWGGMRAGRERGAVGRSKGKEGEAAGLE